MKKTIILAAALVSLAFALSAQANTFTLVNDTMTGAGPYTWNYCVSWGNSQLNAGDFVSLTGAQGITSAAAPAGWSVAVTGGGTGVTWTWTGTVNPLGSGSGTITGFSLTSSFGVAMGGAYNSMNHVFGTPIGGLTGAVGAKGGVDVPGVITVPDGGSAVALLGIALAGIEAARRMFRARKA